LAVSVLAMVSVMAAGAWALVLADRAEKSRAAEAEQRGKAEEASRQLLKKTDDLEKAGRELQKKTEEAAAEARAARRREYDADMLLTQNAWEQHQVDRFLDLLKDQVPRPGQEDLRGFEWYFWRNQFQRGHVTLKGHAGDTLSVVFSPDGKRLASAGRGYDAQTRRGYGEVKVWDAATGQLALTLKGHTGGALSVAFSQLALPESSEAMLKIAGIHHYLRRLCPNQAAHSQRFRFKGHRPKPAA
jgi:hypothetical protein